MDKSDFERKAKHQLDEMKDEIDKLKKKAEQAGAGAQAEIEKQLIILKSKQQEAKQKLGELQQRSGDAWDDLKIGVDIAWQDLKEAIGSASERFK